MKRSIIVASITVFILLFAPYVLKAADRGFGLGFILGSPSGVTGKLFLNKSNAVDAGLGVAAGDGFYLYGDYLMHFSGVFPVDNLDVYFGLGPGFHRYEKEHKKDEDDEENRLEARLPVGLEYFIDKVPLGIFIEVAPALRVVPDIDFDFRAGIGLRYYF
jgi:hypothetical protein